MTKSSASAAKLHEKVPPDWYYRSIRENILQRFWHKRRFREVAKLVEPAGGKILDIGSADGVFSKVLLDHSKAEQVIGIDVLEDSIEWARKHWQSEKKLIFKVGDAHKLEFKDGTFDAVFALEVLEHVFDPQKVLREINRVLKRGGYTVFLVPTDTLLFKLIWFFWTKLRGKIWKDTHIQTFRNDYLVDLSKQLGFQIEENKKFILGMLHVVKVRKSKF